MACGNILTSEINNGVVVRSYPDFALKIGIVVASTVFFDGINPIHMAPRVFPSIGSHEFEPVVVLRESASIEKYPRYECGAIQIPQEISWSVIFYGFVEFFDSRKGDPVNVVVLLGTENEQIWS